MLPSPLLRQQLAGKSEPAGMWKLSRRHFNPNKANQPWQNLGVSEKLYAPKQQFS